MGWYYQQRDKGQSNKDYFEREFPSIRILDCATVKHTFYAAAERRDSPGEVFALVILINWAPGDRFNFGYKDMDETMGPCECECPARILDLLTPTASEWANTWRASCRAHADKMAAKPRVKTGDLVRFATPIRFTSGVELDTFRFEKRSTFTDVGGYRRFNLGGDWRQLEFEIVAA
jgi:hypothetical protein